MSQSAFEHQLDDARHVTRADVPATRGKTLAELVARVGEFLLSLELLVAGGLMLLARPDLIVGRKHDRLLLARATTRADVAEALVGRSA